jgi:hypothetical protein
MDSPIDLLASLAIFGTFLKAFIDAIRRKYPRLDGLVVQLLAAAGGAGIAWSFDLQGTEAILGTVGASVGRYPPVAIDYIITGIAIAAGAGLLAELSGKSGQPTPVIVEVGVDGNPL